MKGIEYEDAGSRKQEAGSRKQEAEKAMEGRLHQCQQLVGQRVRKLGVVDVSVKLAHTKVRVERRSQGSEKRFVCYRIVEWLAFPVNHADATQRQKNDRWPCGAIELLRNATSDVATFVSRRTHQRHLRIVPIQPATIEAGGHGLGCAEVHHVERTNAHHLRNTSTTCGAQPIRSRSEHATDDLIGPLGGCDVENSGKPAIIDEAFHRPATAASRVEHED